jgi:hypothetical protein
LMQFVEEQTSTLRKCMHNALSGLTLAVVFLQNVKVSTFGQRVKLS